MSEGQTEASIYQQAENGKTELSLMHFTIKNPRWQPPQESSVFISHLKEKVHQDAQGGPSAQLLLSETPLCSSLLSNGSGSGVSNPQPIAPHTDHHSRPGLKILVNSVDNYDDSSQLNGVKYMGNIRFCFLEYS